jgi:hypothetical protein
MKRVRKQGRRRVPDVIPLNDLTPRGNPKGGSGGSTKMVFGERPIVTSRDEVREVGRQKSEKNPSAMHEEAGVAQKRRKT